MLGYVRHNDFIPHDVEIDVYVHLNDTRKVRGELPKYRLVRKLFPGFQFPY